MKIISRYLVIILAVLCWGCSAEMARDGSFTLNPNQSQNASGSLHDNNNSCMPYATTGTFATATTLDGNTTYITANVNVTVPGMYSISTDRQNGVAFNATGVFTKTGTQTVRLVPSGTFQTATGTDYTLSYGGTSCPVHIEVTAGTGNGGTNPGTGTGTDPGTGTNPGTTQGTFSITINGKVYTGSDILVSVDNITGTNMLTIQAVTGTSMMFNAVAPSSKVTATTYNTTGNSQAAFTMASGTNVICMTTSQTVGAVTTLTVSSVANNIMTGTFSGKTMDMTGMTLSNITGTITAPIIQ